MSMYIQAEIQASIFMSTFYLPAVALPSVQFPIFQNQPIKRLKTRQARACPENIAFVVMVAMLLSVILTVLIMIYIFAWSAWIRSFSNTVVVILSIKRDLKQTRTATAVNKQLNFTVKNKPHITNYIYCIFEAYFMIKSVWKNCTDYFEVILE